MAKAPFKHYLGSPLSSAGELLAAAGVPSESIIGVVTDAMAVVGGGGDENEPSNDPNIEPENLDIIKLNNTVDSYGTDATKNNMPPMSEGRLRCASSYVNNCAVFAGGAGVNEETEEAYILDTVEAFTSFGEHRDLADLDVPRFDLAAASNGEYVLFAGGSGPIDPETGMMEPVSTIDVYQMNLTKVTAPVALGEPVTELCGVQFGNWAVFAGGQGQGIPSDRVIAFDRNLIAKRDIEPLSVARSGLAAAVVVNPNNPSKSYLILAGGYDGYKEVDTVDVYDQDWNKVAKGITPLSQPRSLLKGNGTGGYALFAGGFDGTNDVVTVDIYDYNLQKLDNMELFQARVDMATAVVDDKIFFFGGDASGYVSNIVDIFSFGDAPAGTSTITYHWLGGGPVPPEDKIKVQFQWGGESPSDKIEVDFSWGDTRNTYNGARPTRVRSLRDPRGVPSVMKREQKRSVLAR